MLVSLSWKNIWRKPSRSLVLVAAILFGLSGGVFSVSISQGMMNQRNKDEVEQNYSHVQIHNPTFEDNQKLKDTVQNISEVLNIVSKTPNIKNYTTRIKFMGMASSAKEQRPVLIFGIDPEQEKKVTTVYKCLLDSESQYLPRKIENEILISAKMAQNLSLITFEFTDLVSENLLQQKFDKKVLVDLKPILNVEIRNKKSFKDSLRKYLVSEAYDKYSAFFVNKCTKYKLGKKIILRFTNINGNIVDEAFKITGVYVTTDMMFDNMNVFVHKEYLAKLLNVSPTTTNEVALKLNDIKQSDVAQNFLAEKLQDLSVKSFKQLDPYMMVKGKYIDIYYYFIIGFILFALSFGIINTVLMSVVERTKEIGMLMSVGMSKARVFSMIMLESVFISLTGGVLGMLFGAGLSSFFVKNGMSLGLTGDTLSSFGFPSVIYPVLDPKFFFGTTILVILAGILSSVYPALRALKLKPSDAIRTDA